MKERTKVRYIPKRASYLAIDLAKAPERRFTRHVLRLPMLQVAHLLLEGIIEARALMVDTGEVLPPTEEGEPVRRASKRSLVVSTELAAASVGICWAHPKMDLEVNREGGWREFDDIRDYGAIVYEEMTEAGYTEAHLGDLFERLCGPLVDLIPQPKEVASKEAFTEGASDS